MDHNDPHRLAGFKFFDEEDQVQYIVEGFCCEEASASGKKGSATPLISKHKGHGTVPHFKGKLQSELLEKDPMVAIEVYACVTCLYSQSAFADDPDEGGDAGAVGNNRGGGGGRDGDSR